MPYDHMMYYYPFMSFWTSLIWLVGIAIVAYLIYKLIKSEKILAPNKPLIKSAQDLLEERYVKGELTREQFLQMKDDIKKPTEG
jgi:putative membrane protein